MNPQIEIAVVDAVNDLLSALGNTQTVEELMCAQEKVNKLISTLDDVLKGDVSNVNQSN